MPKLLDPNPSISKTPKTLQHENCRPPEYCSWHFVTGSFAARKEPRLLNRIRHETWSEDMWRGGFRGLCSFMCILGMSEGNFLQIDVVGVFCTGVPTSAWVLC